MNHQRLKCYGLLLETAKRMPNLVAKMPRGEGYLIDQFKRALSSAILNLAEGNGRQSLKERRRFFDISLASIAETASVLDILLAYRSISIQEDQSFRENLRIAYAMIMNLKQSVF